MSSGFHHLTPEAYQHILDTAVREHPVLTELRAHTHAHTQDSNMQIAPDQGQLMQFLVKMQGAQQVLEVGCFTGYSALAMALALPADGHITTCDVSEEWTRIGQDFWQQAGVSNKITLKIAPALETLESLVQAGKTGQFDFMFIDADKLNYPNYFEYGLQLVRQGGVIAVDNVMATSDLNVHSDRPYAKALVAFNHQLHGDDRIDICMIPIGGGLTLCRVR